MELQCCFKFNNKGHGCLWICLGQAVSLWCSGHHVFSLVHCPHGLLPDRGELGQRAWPPSPLPFLKSTHSMSPTVLWRPVCSALTADRSVPAGCLRVAGTWKSIASSGTISKDTLSSETPAGLGPTQWSHFSRSTPCGRSFEDCLQKTQDLSERNLCRRREGEGFWALPESSVLRVPLCGVSVQWQHPNCFPPPLLYRAVSKRWQVVLGGRGTIWWVSRYFMYHLCRSDMSHILVSLNKSLWISRIPEFELVSNIFANWRRFIRWTENFICLVIFLFIRMLGFNSENPHKCNCEHTLGYIWMSRSLCKKHQEVWWEK